MFASAALVPLVLSRFLVEHVTGSLRLPIVVGPCLMEAHWPPTLLSMLEDVPHWCSL